MSSADAQIFTNTTVFQTEKCAEGEWKITEIKSDPPEELESQSANRRVFEESLTLGFGVRGYYDADAQKISVTPTLAGSPLGTRYTAGVGTGVTIGIDVWAAAGTIRVFEEDNQLKVQYVLGTFWTPETSDIFVISDI